jgi:hypothetical protein
MHKRILVSFLLVSAMSFAFFFASYPSQIASASTIEKQQPTPYTLEVNGTIIDTSVSPIVINGRALVPAREVFEELGAVVTWDTNLQLVTVSYHDTTIQLIIDSTRAKINRQAVVLDVPAKIISGRTLIPLRFVGESMGATVNFHPEEMKISIKQDQNKNLNEFKGLQYVIQDNEFITITIPNVIQYQKMFLQPNNMSSYRIVIDLLNTITKKQPSKIDLNTYPLRAIRYNSLDENTAKNTNLPLETVRIVMDLETPTEYEVNRVENSIEIKIKLIDPTKIIPIPVVNRGSLDSRDVIKESENLSSLQEISLGNGLLRIFHEAHGIINTKPNVQKFGNMEYHKTGDRIALILNNSQLTSGRSDLVPLYTSRYDSTKIQYTITFDSINASIVPGVYQINDEFIHSITVMQIKDRTR